ncbi:uncharacterized protein LOC134264616, partial [Saccostrea cucullata]|uniref:uncharacterized protein LOC134264616 n=1 Tax=Saccostrea cuccullata TaxID=36930 RepID=UPI002ED6A0A0
TSASTTESSTTEQVTPVLTTGVENTTESTSSTVTYTTTTSEATTTSETSVVTSTTTGPPGEWSTSSIQEISGLQINYPTYSIYGELTTFNISISSGNNHTTIAVIENQTTVVCSQDSDLLVFEWTYNFTQTGAINLEIIIVNDVSQVSQMLVLYKYYAINGISTNNISRTFNTSENITMNFELDSNAQKPQGLVNFSVTWGDTWRSEGVFEFDNEILLNEISAPLLLSKLSHSYTIQGNYTVIITLISPVHSQNISYVVYVWDKLSVFLHSNSAAKVNEIMWFQFSNPPNSNFRYFVTYGDGTTRENSDSDLYRSYDVSPWTKTYSKSELYVVTMNAWNPMYTTFVNYTINITDYTPVRLRGGNVHFEGSVEVYYSGSWVSLCDTNWNNTIANMVCFMAGFARTSAIAYYGSQFGVGEMSRMSAVCEGLEWDIIDCVHSLELSSCHVAGVRCSTEGVFLFKLSYDQDATISLLSRDHTVINFDYVSESPSFEAFINNSTMLNTQSVLFDTENKTIQFNLTSQMLSVAGFGTHIMQFRLSNENYSKEVEVEVNHEEDITQYEIQYNSFIELGKPAIFNVSVASGSNLQFTWVHGNTVKTCNYTGNNLKFFQFNYTFTDFGIRNVTTSVSNELAIATKSFTVVVFHKINGITINTRKSTYQTLEDVDISLTVAESALQPQGQVNASIDFGNGNITNCILSANDTYLTPILSFTHQFDIQGNYSVRLVLRSLGDTVFQTYFVQVWDELAVNLSSVTQSKVDTDIEFTFGSTPRSNFMYYISFGDGTSIQNQESDLYREYDLQSWNKSYRNPGIYNVSMTAWNPVYTSYFSYLIKVTQDQILNFTLDADKGEVIEYIYGESKEVLVYFETINNTVIDVEFELLIGEIEINPDLIFINQTSEKEKHINLPLSLLLQDVQFGNHSMNMTLYAQNRTEFRTLAVLLYYEEKITGLQVSFEENVEVGVLTVFNASITSGSNLVVEWMHENVSRTFVYSNNKTRSFSYNYTFLHTGDINVTVLVTNLVSSQTFSLLLHSYYRINGIYLKVGETYQTTELAEIAVIVNDSASQPQGEVSLILDYGDKTNVSVSLSTDSFNLKSEFNTTHHYDIQGNYNVTAYMVSPIGSETLMSIVYVWDKLAVNLSSEVEKKVYENITFEFGNNPNSNFLYKVSYGDGEIRQNNDSDLYRSYDFQSWNKSYEYPALYNVTLYAWNPLYSSFHSYLIYVSQDQITNFTVDGNSFLPIKLISKSSIDVRLNFATLNNTYVPDLLFKASINNITIDTNSAIINQVDDNVIFTMTTFLMDNFTYGVYEIIFSLLAQNETEEHILNMTLIYEQAIEDILVEYDLYTEVGHPLEINATMINGSNMNTEWFLGPKDKQHFLHPCNDTQSFIFNHTFGETGEINVTVIGKNLVSQIRRSFTIFYYYAINGFLLLPNDTVQTIENATIVIQVENSANQPQGVVDIDVHFGDGDSTNISLDANDPKLAIGVPLTHHYVYQGYYKITAILSSEINSINLTKVIGIWDKLDVKLAQVPPTRVDHDAEFEFISTPNSNFLYNVTFDDGTFITNKESDLYYHYNFSSWNKSYSQPKKYYTVTVKAWNPRHTSENSILVLIEYPLHEGKIGISPSTEMIPRPDGRQNITMNLLENLPDPSNVVCTFDNDEDPPTVNVPIPQFGFNHPIKRNYTFKTDGDKNVTFTCHNSVSSYQGFSLIKVRSFTAQDFNYTFMNPVNMNMSLVPTSPSDGIHFPFKPKHDPVDVTFNLTLFECSRLPPNIETVWEFGDGSTEEKINQTEFEYIHKFTKRGNYTMTFKILDHNYNTESTRVFNITLGTMILFCDKPSIDLRKENFTLTATKMFGNVSYTFQVDILENSPNVSHLQEIVSIYESDNGYSTTNVSLQFFEYGFYLPKVTGNNGTITEVVYLDNPIIADYNISGEIDLVLDPSSWKVVLPPGEVKFLVEIVNKSEHPPFGLPKRPFTHCSLRTGDLVDKAIYSQVFNITSVSPMQYNYTYISLGNLTVSITCSNNISEVTIVKPIYVGNDCYSKVGLFDRKNSMPNESLTVSTATDVYIYSRMDVHCIENNTKYNWTIRETDEFGSDKEIVLYDNPLGKNTATFLITKGSFEAGLYKIELNVTLATTYFHEHTYMTFKDPPPFAYIVGGNTKTITSTTSAYEFDASLSHNGKGGTENIDFSWNCKTLTQDPFELFDDGVINLNPGQGGNNCQNSVAKTDKYIYEISGLTAGRYEAIVTVSIRNSPGSTDSYTQVLVVDSGDLPILSLSCSRNCLSKVGVAASYALRGQCSNCEGSGSRKLLSEWKLWSEEGNEYKEVANFTEMTETTGITREGITIEAHQLEMGKKYLIAMKGSFNDSGPNYVYKTFRTNFPPYNGECQVNTTTDTINRLSVDCNGWLDEGLHESRNVVRDQNNNVVLLYQYETEMTKNTSFGIQTITSILYRGGESTITSVPVQAGDNFTDYNVTIRVKIIDEFGDFSLYETIIPIIPPAKPDSTEVFFEGVLTSFAQAKAGGNDMSAVGVLGAAASLFDNVTNSKTVPTEQEVLSNTRVADEVTVNPTPDPVEQLYIQKLREIINILKSGISLDCSDNPKRFSINDIQHIFGTLDSLTRLKQYIPLDVLEDLTGFIYNMTYCFESVISNVTTELDEGVSFLPLEYYDIVRDTIDVAIRVLNTVMDKMLPAKLMNLDVELNLDDIEEEMELKSEFENKMNAHLGISNVTNYKEKSNQIFLLRQHEREIQLNQTNITARVLANQQNVIETIQGLKLKTLALGEKSLVSTSVLDIVTQKIAPDDMDETYMKKFETNKTELTIKVIVYKRNPYNFVENASSLTTGVSSIDLGPGSTVDSVIKNPPVPAPVEYEPKIQTTFPEAMIYYKFEVENDGDAGVVFFKPDNFDITKNPNDTLYSFYFSSVYFPTSQDLEIVVSATNWSVEDDGFKIFLDGGVCNKGICYMGIKLGEVDITDDTSDSSTSRRRRRDTSQSVTTPGYNESAPFTPTSSNFSMAITTTGCRSYDKATDSWTSNNCQVLRISTKENTVCRCTGTTFSSTFVVPLSTIDFTNVWGKFDPSNAAVYGTLIAFLVVYALAAIYLRRQDKKDEEKWATHFLKDTDGADTNFYLLSVYTGMRKGAGTLSNVNFVISGDEADTGIRSLSDGVRKGFETASVNKYVMGNSESLGNLTHIRIWHDNSGPKGRRSWYLNRIVVDDLRTQERYIFLCDKWLAIDEEDGMIDRILPVSSKDDITSFNTLFSEHTQSNITEQHLWLSMFIRPKRSVFTRVQRLSCLLSLLFLTMITNAMFFRSSDEDKVEGVLEVGVIRISVTTIIVSVIGISITTPPIMFITFAFRKSRPAPRKRKKAKKDQPISTISYKKNTENSSVIEKEAPEDMEDEMQKNTVNKDENLSNNRENVDLEDLLDNSSLPLPHWVRRIAWFVVFLSVLTSAFFLLLYSMEWGIAKSEEWLSSFLLSFLESLLCVDPLKVLLISAVFALIFRKMADESVPPKVEFEKLQSVSKTQFKTKSREGFNALVNNIVTSQKPLSEEQVAIMRKKRQEERTARNAMITLLVYAVYVSAIYSISYMERDQRAYSFKESLDNFMYSSFSKISETDSFFSWLKGSLLPTYFPQRNYANQTIFFARDLQYFGDNVSIRIGPPRLRQVRMGQDDCEYSRLTWPYPCYSRYSMTDEDDHSYCLGWRPYEQSCLDPNDKTMEAWKFTSAFDIWGIPKAGEYNTYSGGGYVISLKETITEATNIVNDLLNKTWIDRRTRAVFLEFVLYNPNVNLFAYVMFLTEFTELGRAFTWYESEAFRPVASASAVGSYVIACYSIFIAYVIYSFVKFIRGIRNLGCPAYLKHPWHYVDMIMAFLGFAAIGVYIVRIQAATKAMDLYYDQLVTGSKFINFANIVLWDNTFSIIFAILVFVSIIQFLRILGYSKKVTEIISVITNVGKDLYGFLIMFSIMFFTFVGTGYLLFGSTVKEYKSFFSVIGSLTNTFIGVNSLDALIESNPAIARTFYFMYILLVIMTLFTIFAAILNKSISEVKDDSESSPDVVGVMDIVLKSAKSALSFVPTVGKTDSKEDHSESWSDLQDELRKGNVSALNVMRLVRETFSDVEGVQTKPVETVKPMTGIQEFLLNVDKENSERGSASPKRDIWKDDVDDDERRVRFQFL